MKLATVRAGLGPRLIPTVLRDDGFHALDVAPGTTLLDLLRRGPDALRAAAASAGRDPLENAAAVAPFRPPTIIAIGRNYMDHVLEQDAEPPEQPLIFAKLPSSVIGPDAPIVIDPRITHRVDWEVELGVVIGRRTRSVGTAEALDCVAGYTAANDVSARDLQFGDGQWVRGKSLDTFCPLGPALATSDEIPDPQHLRLSTRVNGEVMQDSSTSEMIFGVADLVAYCSQMFTLEAGDLILTGTPWGCGEFMEPKRHLQPGDVVEVEVEGIGRLRNPVAGVGGR